MKLTDAQKRAAANANRARWRGGQPPQPKTNPDDIDWDAAIARLKAHLENKPNPKKRRLK